MRFLYMTLVGFLIYNASAFAQDLAIDNIFYKTKAKKFSLELLYDFDENQYRNASGNNIRNDTATGTLLTTYGLNDKLTIGLDLSYQDQRFIASETEIGGVNNPKLNAKYRIITASEERISFSDITISYAPDLFKKKYDNKAAGREIYKLALDYGRVVSKFSYKTSLEFIHNGNMSGKNTDNIAVTEANRQDWQFALQTQYKTNDKFSLDFDISHLLRGNSSSNSGNVSGGDRSQYMLTANIIARSGKAVLSAWFAQIYNEDLLVASEKYLDNESKKYGVSYRYYF